MLTGPPILASISPTVSATYKLTFRWGISASVLCGGGSVTGSLALLFTIKQVLSATTPTINNLSAHAITPANTPMVSRSNISSEQNKSTIKMNDKSNNDLTHTLVFYFQLF